MLIRNMMAGMQHSSTKHITNTHPVPCMTPCRYIFTYVDFGVVQILLTIVVFVCFTWFVFLWFTGSHGFYLLDSHGFPLVSTGFHGFSRLFIAFHGFSPVSHFGKVCVFVLVFQLRWVCVWWVIILQCFWCSGCFGGWPWQQRVWWQDCLNIMFFLEHACVSGVQGD